MGYDIQIVPRETIPPIHEVQEGGETYSLGELRDFRWHDQLREFMPADTQFSISWVRLQHGEVLQPHRHPVQSMMVFYAGSGEILGDRRGAVREGDVVFVPAGNEHGFVGGPDGLYALSIQFAEGLYTQPEKPRVLFTDEDRSLQALLAYNRKRIAEFAKRPVFDLLADGTLDDAKKRNAYLAALQIWVDGNQTLLFSRQATCKDPAFEQMFFRHMQDELGHDVLHKQGEDGSRVTPPSMRDSYMEAITNWFAHQMFVLDNVEKTAIIHLVIENASVVYHRAAKPALAKYTNNHYFEVHVEADDGHAAMGEALLHAEAPHTYERLEQVVGEAWDMIGAMVDRLVEITRAA